MICDSKVERPILVKSTYAKPLRTRQQIEEIPCYGNRIDIALDKGRKRAFTVEIPDKGKLEYATLRIGVSRLPDLNKKISVQVNGKPYTVPMESCAERLTEKSYKSCKIIPLAPQDLKSRNVIYVSFPDGQPGSISNVVIRAGFSDSSN